MSINPLITSYLRMRRIEGSPPRFLFFCRHRDFELLLSSLPARFPSTRTFVALIVLYRAVEFRPALHAFSQSEFDAIDNHSSSSFRLKVWWFRKVVIHSQMLSCCHGRRNERENRKRGCCFQYRVFLTGFLHNRTDGALAQSEFVC